MQFAQKCLRFFFFTSVLLGFYVNVIAQQSQVKFGSVPESDLNMKLYPGDEEAEALVLYDKGEVSFFIDREKNQINLIYKRTRRVKILKQSALEMANVTIGYYQGGYNRNQQVRDIRAFSHGINDGRYQQRSLDISQVFNEKIDTDYSIKKFSIPNVKVGSVIEYQYTIETPNSNSIPDWEFQSTIPTRLSEFQVNSIPFYGYTYLLQGRNKFSSSSSKKSNIKRSFAGIQFSDVIYNFSMKNLSAFKDETFITSKSDYIIKMDWQLTELNYTDGRSEQFMTSWPEIANELLKAEGYGKFMQSSYRSARKKIVSELSLSGLSELEKAKKISEHVKNNYKWNGYYQKYTSLTPKEFQKQKTGSSAEINLHLIGLLKAAGIEAQPVLISTRNHGKVKEDYPIVGFFNSSIVAAKIEDSFYLLDGTDPMLPFSWLPPACINEKGFIVEKNSESWIDLSAEPVSTVRETMNLNIDTENGVVIGEFKKALSGYDAIRYKKDSKLIKNELEDYEIEGEIEELNKDKTDSPFIVNYKAEVEAIDMFSGIINIRPFLNKPWGTNPLKAKTRTYPVDLIYKRNREYISNINIPEGYDVDILPKGISVDNDLVKIEYIAVQNTNSVSTQASYLFKKSVYQPEEYKKIRQHIDTFIEKFNERIVFKKN